MYGGLGKLGRGGGGGAGGRGGGKGGGKRSSLPLPPPPLHHPRAVAPAASRLGIGARDRHGGGTVPGGGAGASAAEESFSMVSAGPLDFAALIRLTPDLVDEIRRVEALGGAARIKFDSNSNNPSGNVIDVGGKEFRFTWARELGELCDIYEERQNGEDGHGLLAECGSAWRKLNVQRILDESTKNHVKMLSEEAERKSKSRKAIVLDPGNPSVKNQAKTAAAAVEGNMRRMNWKQTKEPVIKKRKVESSQVSNTAPPKSFFKSGTSLNNAPRGRHSVSPLPSPPDQTGPGVSASPFGIGNPSRGHASADESSGPLMSNKEDAAISEKDISNKVARGATRKVGGHKGIMSSQQMDLRSMLIRLLSENPKGMSLKALEKAVGETIPDSLKKIESIIKNIATFHAPGRYRLKPGVEMDSFKKPLSESGSSPESAHEQSPVAEFVEKATTVGFEQQAQLNSKIEEGSDLFEKVDMQQNSADPFTNERKVSNDSEAKACSSSESGSDSESESDSSDSGSDSESQSRSRSKSRSPLRSGSASSSDSESGGSSSSSQGSDEDVDIMKMDDDKEEADHTLQAIESRLSVSPGAYDGGHERNDIEGSTQDGRAPSPPLNLNDEKDDNMVHAAEIIEDIPIVNSVKTPKNKKTEIIDNTQLDPYQKHSSSSEEVTHFSLDVPKQSGIQQVPYVGISVYDIREQAMRQRFKEEQLMVKNSSGHEQSALSEGNSRAKCRRASDLNQTQVKPESAKRSKATSSAQPMALDKSKDTNFSGNSRFATSDRPKLEQYSDHTMVMSNDVNQDENTATDLQKGYGSAVPGRSMKYGNLRRMYPSPDSQSISNLDAQQLGQGTGDVNARGKAFDGMERYVENFGRGIKHAERMAIRLDESDASAMRSMPLQDKLTMPKDKLHKSTRDEDGDACEKHLAYNYRDGFLADQLSSLPESHHRRSGEQSGIQKAAGQMSHMHQGDIDKFPVANGKGNKLRREPSDLELGEFREPVSAENTHGGPRLFERKNSFKSSVNKGNAKDNLSSDWDKGRSAAKATQESKRQSPPYLKGGLHCNQDGFHRRMSDDDFMDSTRPQQRAMLPQAEQFPRADCADSEAVSQLEQSADTVGRNDTRTCQGIGPENNTAGHKKTPASMVQQHDTKYDSQMGSRTVMESKTHKSSASRDSFDRRKDSFLIDSSANNGIWRESFLEEDDSFYAKYEKDEPEMKGPIKDFLQYEEYVQEFKEKYDCYLSLNKNLESYRNDFLKLGRDLELAKGRDMEAYYNISEQMKKIYRRIKTRHTRMKNTFIMLYEELKNLKQKIKDFVEAYTRN